MVHNSHNDMADVHPDTFISISELAWCADFPIIGHIALRPSLMHQKSTNQYYSQPGGHTDWQTVVLTRSTVSINMPSGNSKDT